MKHIYWMYVLSYELSYRPEAWALGNLIRFTLYFSHHYSYSNKMGYKISAYKTLARRMIWLHSQWSRLAPCASTPITILFRKLRMSIMRNREATLKIEGQRRCSGWNCEIKFFTQWSHLELLISCYLGFVFYNRYSKLPYSSMLHLFINSEAWQLSISKELAIYG